MKNSTSTPITTLLLGVALIAAGAILWQTGQGRIRLLRQSNTTIQNKNSQIEAEKDRMHELQKQNDTTAAKLKIELKRNYDQVNQLETDFARINPESRWAEPPLVFPKWLPESPYIWISKESLTNFPMSFFDKQMLLRSPAAEILDLDPDKLRLLNSELKDVLENYRQEQRANIQKKVQIDPQTGEETWSIQYQTSPELARHYEEQFKTTLEKRIGSQRAKLLADAGQFALKTEFPEKAATENYSLVRHSNGTFSIHHKGPDSSGMHGGLTSIDHQAIPPMLRPIFQPLFEKNTATFSTQ